LSVWLGTQQTFRMLSFAVVLLMSVSSSIALEYRYEAYSDLASFADAQTKCTGKGGELAVPDSAAEEAKIAAAVTAVDGEVDWKSTPFSGHKFYWLNIEEDEDNAPLTELSYTNYHKSQPNRASEKCVSAALARGGQWSDRPCDAVTAYVCQFENIDMKCWNNRIPQQLTNLEGTNDVLDKYDYRRREDPIIKCQVAAQEGEYSFFAIGNKGQCWAGHGEDYKKQGQAKCPAGGLGKYAIVHVYQIITEPTTTTTTTPPPTTTPEPTHKCGRSNWCKDRSEYCSSGKCVALRAKGKFCSSDRQCLSKDCAWYYKCK